jgi:hypothetical protein
MQIMRKLILSVISIFYLNCIYSQQINVYQKGLSADQNLNAITNLAPYSTGGVGFDNRYEGIKGSSRLFDKLLPSFLRIKGQDYYIQVDTDIDLYQNKLLFIHPKTGKLLSIPSDIVSEVIIKGDEKDLLYRTTADKNFEKEISGQKFFQVLKDGSFQLIKMPVKILIEADYKAAYSSDRRYDEFNTKYRYYILCSDSLYHQVTLTKKSLLKLFPDKKDIINHTIESKSFPDDEEMVIAVLNKF